MTTTEKGIYYPNDETQPADVLGDMKKMAESIDEAINDNKYDDTKIKEEQEKQNKSIEKNAENIEDNATDIQDLKTENANLKAQIPTGTAAGKEISLIDSAEMELVDFRLQGNSKQAIREGYNLLPPFESTVLNGITYTKNEDGTITANGTATADSFYRQNINLEEGDYYLSGSPTGGANNTYFLQAMGYGEAGNDYGSGTTFKVTTSSSVGIRIMIYQGVTVNNLVFKPMIVKGTEKKDYEQYGVSPSLDYPSEVEAVGDNINLYPFESIEFQSNTPTESWCYIDGKVGAYGNTVTDKTDYKITLEKGEYYFKLETDDSNIITGGLVANDTNSEKQLTLFDNAFEITETTVCTLRLKVANPSLGINIKSIKLEKGTVSTPYSQYGQGSIEIVKSNKNILDWLDLLNKIGITLPYTKEVSGITFKIDEKGTISVKGRSTSTINLYLIGSYTSKVVKYIINNAKDTIASGFNNNWSKGLTSVFLDNSSETNIHLDFYDSKNNKCTKDKFNVTGIMFGLNSGVTIDEKYNLMLEKATIATNFIEHQGNTYTLAIQKPFYKIGDYADKLIKQIEKWYEQHIIKEYTITGNENFVQADVDRFYVTNLITSIASENSVNCLSNYFKGDTYTNRWNANRVTIRSNSLTFCTKENYTLEEFKAKLQELYNAGTPVKVYYILATPELIECTEEQTQILEQIIKDGTYKEVTHFYTTEDLKPTIEVKYYKDLETLFKNQTNMQETLNNVQAQLLELGGK